MRQTVQSTVKLRKVLQSECLAATLVGASTTTLCMRRCSYAPGNDGGKLNDAIALKSTCLVEIAKLSNVNLSVPFIDFFSTCVARKDSVLPPLRLGLSSLHFKCQSQESCR